MLDRIPAEVSRLIVAKIRTQSDLKSLCEVSKYVAEFATPRLYESITLHADEILYLDDLKQEIELCSNDNVKFTKNICLRAPLYQDLRKRCPRYDSEMPETLGDAIDMDDGSDVDLTSLDPFWDLSMALSGLLGALDENNLQSLSARRAVALVAPADLRLYRMLNNGYGSRKPIETNKKL
ncbi:hypothetical protein V495_08141 [Pseudogymnoascus sp. VKM F-4514 (FW-929)]|nr:hypothetical protein V495_08141 [Pseudogymnoascus sp. VKM F-4514 (FW-929)]KFY52924.1 hypothetical protein V497_08427 [Pseudogymnoascus sp. VKM F-4516 (FW-969)]